mmetsp:Transcript_31229/g.78182  ORF Transcript_31229/g.78182 Transcript_31229/m.78182 type:complete len:465 (+) Transcript_31229:711-2105(+)
MYAFFLSRACCADTRLRNSRFSRLRSFSSSMWLYLVLATSCGLGCLLSPLGTVASSPSESSSSSSSESESESEPESESSFEASGLSSSSSLSESELLFSPSDGATTGATAALSFFGLGLGFFFSTVGASAPAAPVAPPPDAAASTAALSFFDLGPGFFFSLAGSAATPAVAAPAAPPAAASRAALSFFDFGPGFFLSFTGSSGAEMTMAPVKTASAAAAAAMAALSALSPGLGPGFFRTGINLVMGSSSWSSLLLSSPRLAIASVRPDAARLPSIVPSVRFICSALSALLAEEIIPWGIAAAAPCTSSVKPITSSAATAPIPPPAPASAPFAFCFLLFFSLPSASAAVAPSAPGTSFFFLGAIGMVGGFTLAAMRATNSAKPTSRNVGKITLARGAAASDLPAWRREGTRDSTAVALPRAHVVTHVSERLPAVPLPCAVFWTTTESLVYSSFTFLSPTLNFTRR